jgi:hypothetical protein
MDNLWQFTKQYLVLTTRAKIISVLTIIGLGSIGVGIYGLVRGFYLEGMLLFASLFIAVGLLLIALALLIRKKWKVNLN